MGKKILLADDSITIQKVIELTFSDEDFEVVTVGNGRLAVERVQEVRPDIVLCDIIMPEKDGYEVCDFIKRHPQFGHVPVLLLTGAFEPFDQERAARVGSDGFLAKPFEPQTLIAKVKDLLAQAAARRPASSAPARPVAAAAAAAPTPPRPLPFAAPAPAPVAAAPVAPLAAVPPAPPARVQEPPPLRAPEPAPPAPAPLASEFEVFYPTPEEIEPLAASPEFEPVFAPSEFEGADAFTPESDTVEVPVVVVPPPAPPAPAPLPAAAFAPEHAAWAADAAPSFIPDDPFEEQDATIAFQAPAALEPPATSAPAVEPEPEPEPVLYVEDALTPADELAALAPDALAAEADDSASESAEFAATWSDPTLAIPLEERARASVEAAYGAPAPAAYEESFEEAGLTLEDELAPPVEAPPAAPAEEPLLPPDDLMSDMLVADEAQTQEPPPPPASVYAESPLDEVEPGLFTALSEEESATEAEAAALPVDDVAPWVDATLPATAAPEPQPEPVLSGYEAEPAFDETEPALTLDPGEFSAPPAIVSSPALPAGEEPDLTLDDASALAELAPPPLDDAPEPQPIVAASTAHDAFEREFEPASFAAPEPIAVVPPAPEPVLSAPAAAEPEPVAWPAEQPEVAWDARDAHAEHETAPLAAPVAAARELTTEVSFEDLSLAAEPVAAPAPVSGAAAVSVPVELVEQIARRVVAQLGDKVIREIAWEVVPDLAEALIKREIERLKAELSQLP